MSAAASDCCQVTTTLPDRALADRVASTLVDARLAACAQVIGPLTSTYHWQGRTETAEEWYCFLKTTASRLPELRARLRALHPYEVPELIAVPIADGDPAYLRWIRESVETPR
jgi:periplasmic divalent cation tolerance protein